MKKKNWKIVLKKNWKKKFFKKEKKNWKVKPKFCCEKLSGRDTRFTVWFWMEKSFLLWKFGRKFSFIDWVMNTLRLWWQKKLCLIGNWRNLVGREQFKLNFEGFRRFFGVGIFLLLIEDFLILKNTPKRHLNSQENCFNQRSGLSIDRFIWRWSPYEDDFPWSNFFSTIAI